MKTDSNESATLLTSEEMGRRNFIRKILLIGTVMLFKYETADILGVGVGARVDKVGAGTSLLEEVGQFPSRSKPVNYFVVKPATGLKFPAVFLVHEVFGLTENVRNLARDLAMKGTLVFIPDCLPTANVHDAGDGVVAPGELEELTAGFAYLTKRADVYAARISGAGRCWEHAREYSRNSYAIAADGYRLYFKVTYYSCRFPFDRMGSLS